LGRGDVAQLVERRIRIAEAWGSNPHISTIVLAGIFLADFIF
jgi:hypothetical protein